MQTQNLTRAHAELFRRSPDEQYPTLEALAAHCREQKQKSIEQWHAPVMITPEGNGHLMLQLDQEGDYSLNDWSFTQLCSLAKVSKDTVNKLRPQTAMAVLEETLPRGTRPIQVLTFDQDIRSIHGPGYTRLWNADLLASVQEFAVDFQPPQQAVTGASGLYCGEQDMFCFLIDPTGWAEIDGEAFAPGFFLWNSEVGKRSVGIQTFWFQAVCQNHIVWDAVEVVEFKRKHTTKVYDSLRDIERIVANLVRKRDARRDSFTRVVSKAMQERLGSDADDALKALNKHGIPRGLAQEAVAIAKANGRFTIFELVDALTRLSRKLPNAGDRVEVDAKSSRLLSLAA